MTHCKCHRCGHEWTARVKVPLACPKCRSYLWNKEKKVPDSNYKRDIKGKNKDGTLKLGKKKRLKRA